MWVFEWDQDRKVRPERVLPIPTDEICLPEYPNIRIDCRRLAPSDLNPYVGLLSSSSISARA